MRRPGFGVVVLVAVGLGWAFSLVSGYDIIADVHPELASQGPTLNAWLGTDHLGRDVAWRLLVATLSLIHI